MINRLHRYVYRLRLKMRGAKLPYPILGKDFLFGNAKGLQSGAYIMLESFVKLNISGDDAILDIGDYVYINSFTVIDCHYRVKIGKRVQVGPHCYIGDFDHSINVDVRNPHHRLNKTFAAVIIEDNAWLGAGVIVLKGVTIGKNSVIAAGSVVTSDIPSNVLAGGIPARVIKVIENNSDEGSV